MVQSKYPFFVFLLILLWAKYDWNIFFAAVTIVTVYIYIYI